MLLGLLGLHAALALAAPWLVRRLGRRALLACGLAPGLTAAWVLAQGPAVVGRDEAVVESYAWVPSLGMTADFTLDAFAFVMVLLVSGIGTLIFAYGAGYFSRPIEGYGRFCGSLTAFAGAMLGLVLSDNVLLVFVFWELTSITSFLLIGINDRQPDARQAALQALLVTGAGGLAMLGGMVILGQAAGTYSLSGILAAAPQGTMVTWGLVLVLVGAFTKSAHVPFHTWLPNAMAAPTPVSAYLHSATMVKAGVYLVARLGPVFAVVAIWRPLVITVGVLTMLVGGYRALRQYDLKLLLAYGTVSQLGFMMVMFGIGTPEATFAGVVLILAHGLFKAALFMVAGAVDVQTSTRDIRKLSGLHRSLPVTTAAAAVAAASMAGLPPLVGFIAKEAAFEGLLHGGLGPLGPVALVGVVAGSALTVAYSARFLYGGFATKPGAKTAVNARSATLLAGPAVLLGVLTLAAGLIPVIADGLVNAAARALDPTWETNPLQLWHGVNVALGLSVVVVAAGLVLFAFRATVERSQGRMPAVLGATDAYEWMLRNTVSAARRLTGIVQNGSLPTYLLVILLTVLLLPGSVLVTGASLHPGLPLAANGIQAAICLIAAAAAVGTAIVPRRFAAVLLLGAVGYSVAALFVLQGAPDLALTQLLIETLALVIFVLVLRHLPARFGRRPHQFDRLLRGAVALAVGLGVFAFSLIVAAARTAPSISQEFLARALPEAEGRNVVNVILVDFRALDTLGEIVVLVTAALGISSLVLAGRLSRGREAQQQPSEEPS